MVSSGRSASPDKQAAGRMRTDDVGPKQEDILNLVRVDCLRSMVSRAVAIHRGGLLIIVG
jgi:hypothetical protein